MANTRPKAKVITPEELKNLRYPLPDSWKKAAGLLKDRKNTVDPLEYQRETRKGWEDRLKRQTKLGSQKRP